MKKIYLTLLALIAFIGVQSASATAYTVFQQKASPWRWQIKTDTNGWEYVSFTCGDPIYSFYFSDGFNKCNFAGDNSSNEVYVSDAQDLHMYDGAEDKGVLKVRVNGTDQLEFITRNGSVYSTATQTMNGTSATFTVGFTDGTWYNMVADGTVTVGNYVALKRQDSASSSFSMADGSTYHFELNIANMQIKVVQDSAPETVTWYYQLGDGSKTAMNKSGNNWTISGHMTSGQTIKFFRNDTQMGPTDGEYTLSTSQTGIPAGTSLVESTNASVKISMAGTFGFTITEGGADGSKISSTYTAPAAKTGYICYENSTAWVYNTAMTYDADLDVFTITVSIKGNGCFFFNKDSFDGDKWTKSGYGPNGGNKTFTAESSEDETLYYATMNNRVFVMATEGKYKFIVNGDFSSFSYKRTGGSGGGNWEGADDLNDYVDNENNTDIINYITPSAGSAADAYSIGFTYTPPVAGEKLSQKLTATHSHKVSGSEASYVWMKYETLSWKGENGKETNGVTAEKVPEADALYLSDTHMYENGPRGSLMATSKFMEELKCNSLTELIESREHCVHHNEGTVHTPRNFCKAYYRVYGMHEVSPVAEMNSAKTLSANDRKIKAVVTPSHPARYNARVAFTKEVQDNTSGVTGIEVDKDVIGSEDVAPVYYNLQGVQVSRPSAGQIYIVKRGDKVTKEIIK